MLRASWVSDSTFLPSHLILFYSISFCFIFQPFVFLTVAHLDGIAELSSPTWWIISCTASCNLVNTPSSHWAKPFIILQSFTKGPAQKLPWLRGGWRAPLVWTVFTIFLVSNPCLELKSCQIQKWGDNIFTAICLVSDFLSASKKPTERRQNLLLHLFTIRLHKAPSSWMSPLWVLRNPWRTFTPCQVHRS